MKAQVNVYQRVENMYFKQEICKRPIIYNWKWIDRKSKTIIVEI